MSMDLKKALGIINESRLILERKRASEMTPEEHEKYLADRSNRRAARKRVASFAVERNKLKELIACAEGLLGAREELLKRGWEPLEGRDIDKEHQGFWLKKASGLDRWIYVGAHIAYLGDGVRVRIDNPAEDAFIKPVATKESIVSTIDNLLAKNNLQ